MPRVAEPPRHIAVALVPSRRLPSGTGLGHIGFEAPASGSVTLLLRQMGPLTTPAQEGKVWAPQAASSPGRPTLGAGAITEGYAAMRSWRDRVAAARLPTGGVFVRGFTKLDRLHAGDWNTCAVGEQIRLGRVDRAVLRDVRMCHLGMKFHEAVWMSRFLGRFWIRRAAAILEKIENRALDLDWQRARRSPAPKEGAAAESRDRVFHLCAIARTVDDRSREAPGPAPSFR